MSFFGFLGKVLTGGLSVATHGLINLGGTPTSAAALPLVQTGGFGFPTARMPTFAMPGGGGGPSPGGGSALIPHLACGVSFHHKKPHTKAERHSMFAGKCVKNRHMNVSNPRALRRSIRRLYGAEKMYGRLLKITHPHKAKGGHVHPKPPRKRKS
jgi:hypothetical protein